MHEVTKFPIRKCPTRGKPRQRLQERKAVTRWVASVLRIVTLERAGSPFKSAEITDQRGGQRFGLDKVAFAKVLQARE